jgi:hypothetical protein
VTLFFLQYSCNHACYQHSIWQLFLSLHFAGQSAWKVSSLEGGAVYTDCSNSSTRTVLIPWHWIWFDCEVSKKHTTKHLHTISCSLSYIFWVGQMISIHFLMILWCCINCKDSVGLSIKAMTYLLYHPEINLEGLTISKKTCIQPKFEPITY